MRIVSLLPSATEIVAALGLTDHLVGISHECDYPEEIRDRPRVTRCEIHGSDLPSPAIDAWVRDTLACARDALHPGRGADPRSAAGLDPHPAALRRLRRELRVGRGLRRHVAGAPPPDQPRTLAIGGHLLGHPARRAGVRGAWRAEAVIAELQRRVESVVSLRRARRGPPEVLPDGVDRPTVSAADTGTRSSCSWLAVSIRSDARASPPAASTWEEIQRADPDAVLLACCGFGVERTLRETAMLAGKPEWEGLRAVRQGHVYVADANTYFSRPGPRIVDSLEMLAHMLHPEAGVATAQDGWFLPSRSITLAPAHSQLDPRSTLTLRRRKMRRALLISILLSMALRVQPALPARQRPGQEAARCQLHAVSQHERLHAPGPKDQVARCAQQTGRLLYAHGAGHADRGRAKERRRVSEPAVLQVQVTAG